MKFHRLSILSALLVGSSFAGLNAAIKDLPVKEVNGRSYHYYEVAAKETIYSLCHRLGISREELLKSNPTVSDGLKAGEILFFPIEGDSTGTGVASTAANSGSGMTIINHTVEKGQTIYGIATHYGISTQELIAQNPVVSEGLKAGQTLHLTIPSKNVAAPAVSSESVSAPVVEKAPASGYIVKKKETFYSIANAHGISVAELEAANPGITVLREGQVLTIPGKESPAPAVAVESASIATDTVAADSISAVAPTMPTDSVSAVVAEQPTELSVAVVLPFMLNDETMSKSAQRYTEFYKGFLMAADSIRNNGIPVRITAYDTEGSTAKVHSLITDSDLKNHRMIVAPDNAEHLAMLGEFGRSNGIKVLNNFIVRDETYKTNPAIMQGNIPSVMMLDKAADAMVERVVYSTPVFLTLTDGANDKGDFVDAVKKRLDARGTAYKTIAVTGRLTAADLKELPADGSYSFIMNTSRQSDINKLLPGLVEWRNEAVMPMVKVVGYPEWITFRGETLENMHSLNTLVYSRFFDDEDNARTRQMERKYKNWYGGAMENAVPRQGLLGFDTGMFVFDYLKDPSKSYDGVQNGFDFKASEGVEGVCNNLLYIINYRPGGLIEKTSL